MNEINKMKRLRVAAGDEGEAVKIRAIKEAEVRRLWGRWSAAHAISPS